MEAICLHVKLVIVVNLQHYSVILYSLCTQMRKSLDRLETSR